MRIIAGEARGRLIDAPAGKHTRPTLDRVRENLFNIIQSDIQGSRVLDLFAGSGALSLEAVSRGAAYAVLVDSDRNACTVQANNISKLKYSDRTRVLHCDWHKALEKLEKEHNLFDIVFLDPPYAMTDLREVFSSLVAVIHPETIIVLEHESGKAPSVPDGFEKIKERAWGFCSVTIYTMIKTGG